MRLRGEWTNLGTLKALHTNTVASDTCGRVLGRDRSFQKLLQPLRQRARADAEFDQRAGVGIEDLPEAFVPSQKTRPRKVARAHPGFHLAQRDAGLLVSLCQSDAMIRLAAIAPLAALAVGVLAPTAV